MLKAYEKFRTAPNRGEKTPRQKWAALLNSIGEETPEDIKKVFMQELNSAYAKAVKSDDPVELDKIYEEFIKRQKDEEAIKAANKDEVLGKNTETYA
jgi:flagellar motor switch protein FliG